MINENKKLEKDEAMKVLSDFAKDCYKEGCITTLIGVAIGAGLAIFGYACDAIHEQYKSRKHKKELKKSINKS